MGELRGRYLDPPLILLRHALLLPAHPIGD
jgi:hypothetical protein